MTTKKITVGLVFGGNSGEHEVSIKSAKAIYNALCHSYNSQHFIVNPIYIDKYGFWRNSEYSKSILLEEEESKNTIKSNKCSMNNLTNFPIESNKVDVWFPALHGPNGEDGVIQGLFKLTEKPFVGSGTLGSSLGMDKIAMKSIFKSFNLPQAPYIYLHKENLLDKSFMKSIYDQIEEIINYLGVNKYMELEED